MGKGMDKSWFDDEELKKLTKSSKERIATFFEIESRAVTPGYILRMLKIDHKTIQRILDVMIERGLVERIETTNYTQYRRKLDDKGD